MALSLLQRLRDASQVVLVPMDGCAFHVCDGRQPYCGTENLNGCFAVVIVSKATKAVLLAHIAPRPGMQNSNDPAAGTRHATQKMTELVSQYHQHREDFPSGSVSWTVFAQYDGEIALSDHLEIIRQQLSNLNIVQNENSYNAAPASSGQAMGKGEVFVGFAQGTFVAYVEDARVQLREPAEQPRVATAGSRRSAAVPVPGPSDPSRRVVATTSAAPAVMADMGTWTGWMVVENRGYVRYDRGSPVTAQTTPPNGEWVWSLDNGRWVCRGKWNGQSWIVPVPPR